MPEIRTIRKDELTVRVFDNRTTMGLAAAEEGAAMIRAVAAKKEEINIIFAAAPSQNDFLDALCAMKDLPWERINAFHMDEYIGLPADAPQGFANFLRRAIFDRMPFKQVYYMNGQSADPKAECERYTALLSQHPTDIIFMGIGENGHIAFNDPPVADFNDPHNMKVVELESRCRQQQVNDGCFATLDDVPTHAYTLTIPLMMRVPNMLLVVPTKLKAQAIRDTVRGPITTAVPASIIRTHKGGVTMYTDEPAVSLL